MHIQGLLDIIQRKGGVHIVDHNKLLRLMLAKYVQDMYGKYFCERYH
jgi:hypothetical protein